MSVVTGSINQIKWKTRFDFVCLFQKITGLWQDCSKQSAVFGRKKKIYNVVKHWSQNLRYGGKVTGLRFKNEIKYKAKRLRIG